MENKIVYQAEVEVLGKILLNDKLIYKVNDKLQESDFQTRKNKEIYTAMKLCAKNGKPIQPAILMGYLKDSDVSVTELVKISSSVASTADIMHYVEIVKEASNKQKLRVVLSQVNQLIEKENFKDLAQTAIKQLYAIDQETTQNNHMNREQLMESVLDFIQKGMQSGGETVGMRTGWNAIDKPLKGFNKGDLTLLGGRPSMGKTAFCINLANKLTDRYKVLFFELEMPNHKIGMRELAAESKVALNRLYEPHLLNENEVRAFMMAADKLAKKGNMFYDDTPRATLDYIREKVRFIKEQEGLDIIFVDHIGLIKQTNNSSRNDWIGEVSATLKAIGKEFGVSVIALSQLSREIERRTDKRPVLSDLRDSGNLEQDADAVIFLYRDGYYNPESVTSDVENLEVIIGKNRDGMVGTVNMAINLKLQLVTEIY